jgi:hypothetical protein
MPTLQKITPCVWFDTEAEAGATFYVAPWRCLNARGEAPGRDST